MTATLTPFDAIRYCAEQRWVVVGHELKLLLNRACRTDGPLTPVSAGRDHRTLLVSARAL